MEGEEKGLPERNKGVQSGFGAGTDQKEGKNKEAVQMGVDGNRTEIGGSSDLGMQRSDKESGKGKVDDDQIGGSSDLVIQIGDQESGKSRSNAGDQSGTMNKLKRTYGVHSGLNSLTQWNNPNKRTGDGSKAGGSGTNQDIENEEDDDEMEGGFEGNQDIENEEDDDEMEGGFEGNQEQELDQKMNDEIDLKLQQDEKLHQMEGGVEGNQEQGEGNQQNRDRVEKLHQVLGSLALNSPTSSTSAVAGSDDDEDRGI